MSDGRLHSIPCGLIIGSEGLHGFQWRGRDMTDGSDKEQLKRRATPKRRKLEPRQGSEFPATLVAAKVVSLRTLRGLTQDRVADLMGQLGHEWSRATVSEYERGNRTLTVDEFLGLALVFGVTPLELLSPIMGVTDVKALDFGGPGALGPWLSQFWLNGWVHIRFKESDFRPEETGFIFELTDAGMSAGGDGLPSEAREQLEEYQGGQRARNTTLQQVEQRLRASRERPVGVEEGQS